MRSGVLDSAFCVISTVRSHNWSAAPLLFPMPNRQALEKIGISADMDAAIYANDARD